VRKSAWLIATAIVAIVLVTALWLAGRDSHVEVAAPITDSDADQVPAAASVQKDTPTTPPERYSAPPGKAREVMVDFPNGASASVRLLNMPFPGVPISGSRVQLIDFHDQLARRAHAGETAAAHELARQLDRCKAANESESELFEFCRGIDSTQLAQASMWRQMAIDGGYYWAWQDWARSLRGTPQELEAWNVLWERGYSSALQVLAMRYSQGIAGSPPDYVRAYAYKLIESGLMQAAFKELPSPTPTQQYMLVTVDESLRHKGSYLTPAETETAVALAIELLRNNRNCCIGKWQ